MQGKSNGLYILLSNNLCLCICLSFIIISPSLFWCVKAELLLSMGDCQIKSPNKFLALQRQFSKSSRFAQYGSLAKGISYNL